MRLSIDARRDAQHDALLGGPVPSQFVQQRQLIVVVHDDPPDAALERILQLLAGLAVAVETDVFRIHAAGEGDMQLAGRDDVEPEPLLDQDADQRRAEPGLGCIVRARARELGLEVLQVVAAGLADRVLVVDVERCAEAAVRSRTLQPPICSTPLELERAVSGSTSASASIGAWLVMDEPVCWLDCKRGG